MSRIAPFEKYAEQYEAWFVENRYAYKAELQAVKALLPTRCRSLEIGVGTGRFAGPLGIEIGVEPSERMREIARSRGIKARDGVAESLPFDDSQFDLVLMVTTICFLNNVGKALLEAHRVLSKGGVLIIGLIDRNSFLGQMYVEHQHENVFYMEATFFSVEEIIDLIEQAGFTDLDFRQTIFKTLPEITPEEPVKPGYGEGAFVVIRCRKE